MGVKPRFKPETTGRCGFRRVRNWFEGIPENVLVVFMNFMVRKQKNVLTLIFTNFKIF